MKCLDFVNEIILTLTPEQQKHLAGCPKCRLAWDDQSLERALVNAPFDPAKEPPVDLSGKPPSATWITPEFRRMLEEAKQERLAAGQNSLVKVKKLLEKLYPANTTLRRKLMEIAKKISSQPLRAPGDFDERFAAALGFFPEEKADKMKDADLIDELKKKIDLAEKERPDE